MTVQEFCTTLLEYSAKGYDIIIDACYYGAPLEYINIEIDDENKTIWIV